VLSSVPFSQVLGCRTTCRRTSPALTFRLLSKIPPFVCAGSFTLAGLWWLTNRQGGGRPGRARAPRAKEDGGESAPLDLLAGGRHCDSGGRGLRHLGTVHTGAGWATHLSDRHPWGLWIGFDILCGVGLAAGGFAITTAVYILHLERLRPILRPTILTAFLGYMLVICALMFDLGRPWNIWRAMVWWNPHSVMFEVAWCVMLYTRCWPWNSLPSLRETEVGARHKGGAGGGGSAGGTGLHTVFAASILAGSLYLIMPTKLYRSGIPAAAHSVLALGHRGRPGHGDLRKRHERPGVRRALEFGLLQGVAKVMVLFLGLFLMTRFLDLGARGSLDAAFRFHGPGQL